MTKRILAYTIAYDSEGEQTYRHLSKILVSSLIRSGFNGDIVIFHNGSERIFRLGRHNVYEEGLDLIEHDSKFTVENLLATAEQRWALKHRVSEILLNEYEWDRLLFLDADTLVTRPIHQLFLGDFDLAIYREPRQNISNSSFNCFLSDFEMQNLKIEGVNSGIFCVDRSIAKCFFNKWAQVERTKELRRRCCTDQAALNRVLLDHSYKTIDISHCVSMPFHTDGSKFVSPASSITHWIGAVGLLKVKSSFGLFMETYFFDPNMTLFHLLET